MSLKFLVKGRPVSADQWVNEMAQRGVDAAFEKIRAKIEAARCNQHGQSPSYQGRVESDGNPALQFSYCCENLKEAALRALK